MATACLTVIEAGGREIAVLLTDTDGQPTGHGADLKLLLRGGKMTDFYSEVHLYPPQTRNLGEQYIYTISAIGGDYHLKVEGLSLLYPYLESQTEFVVLFDGNITDFDAYRADDNWRNQ